MTLAELQEKRNKLASEIKQYGENFDADTWDAAKESNWNKLNTEYDSVMSQMNNLRSGGVMDRVNQVNQLQSSTANNFVNGITPGREDSSPGLQSGRRGQGPVMFQNAETGAADSSVDAGRIIFSGLQLANRVRR